MHLIFPISSYVSKSFGRFIDIIQMFFLGRSFSRRNRLKEGGFHKLFLVIGGTFTRGRRLKEGGRLFEDLP